MGDISGEVSPITPEQDIKQMDRKKVLYFGNFKNESPTIDQDILFSLKKQTDVTTVDLREFTGEDNIKKIIDKANKCDVFLFHAFMPETDDFYLQLMLERINTLLANITCKKVLWFVDKIVGNKVKIISTLYDNLDLIFFSDETWLRRFESEKMFPLHPASPEKTYKGRFRKELACNVAMVGNLYGERTKQYEFLKKTFKDSFKFFDDKYNKDYADLCKSAKVILVPKYPFDDFFWSERIYTTLNNGGICIHPRSYGLLEEGFVDGEHYIDYYTEQDLFITLKMLLDKKSDGIRKQISTQGREFVKNHTYGHRIKEIMEKIYDGKN